MSVLQPIAKTGFYRRGKSILTRNATPPKTFFEMEREYKVDKTSYREIDPKRSKLAAAIEKGLQQTGVEEGAIVLYLGASHGYTPSFLSDIVGGAGAKKGMLFCLDHAPRVVRDLYLLCEQRENMAPIMGDANDPDSYKELVPGVDVVYQDVAQRDQIGIFLKNCDQYLKQGGHGLLALKARSVDVTKKPKDIFKQVRKHFEEEQQSYVIIDYRELSPFEKDHAFFVIRKK